MSNVTAIQTIKEKIDELNSLAWEVRVEDSLKSMELSKESVELSRNIHYHSGLAHGLMTLGFSYVRFAKYNEAVPLLQEALNLFEILNDLKGQAIVSEYLAVIQRNRGDFGPALKLLFKALELNEQILYQEGIATDLYQIGVTYKYLGNFEKALDSLYTSLSLFKEANNKLFQSYPLNVLGSIYFENRDYLQALKYYQEGLIIRQQSNDKLGESGSLDYIGYTYFKLNNYPQAIDYCTQSLNISAGTGDKRSEANALQHLAEIYKQSGDTEQAIITSNESLHIRKFISDKRGETEILLFLASLYKEQSVNKDKIFELLANALKISEEIEGLDLLSKARFALYEYYKEQQKFEEAIDQLEHHIQLEKNLHTNTIDQKMLNLEISHKAEEAKRETESVRLRNKELNELNEKIQAQKKVLEITLVDLKSTQSQLVQSEKMAFLGELTAGIAHEIQNPLNFINNFSDVNKELLVELKDEIKKGNLDEVNAIADDVISNEEKISHHGKRADAIVKGMLQHSRSSSGKKEPTDINALADEYLRLAYHGLRAKDKSFNATLETDYDESLGNINIIPQDIGRVILNLITNAFYAVNERKKAESPLTTEGETSTTLNEIYEPTVTVTTRRLSPPSGGWGAQITVTDNGSGIPIHLLDKIFQPFFTTKPTGQGTGLGLSLSYDIIKAHGGELKVQSARDVSTSFIILLPLT